MSCLQHSLIYFLPHNYMLLWQNIFSTMIFFLSIYLPIMGEWTSNLQKPVFKQWWKISSVWSYSFSYNLTKCSIQNKCILLFFLKKDNKSFLFFFFHSCWIHLHHNFLLLYNQKLLYFHAVNSPLVIKWHLLSRGSRAWNGQGRCL